ncbi:MAG TPA: Crp/Fnr family transcriptional regulator [Gammaproteobacteria bacterium]
MPAVSPPPGNRLLAALDDSVLARLLPRLDQVELTLNDVLYEPNDSVTDVYFPVDAIVSLFCVLEDGASAGTAMIGNEGMIGLALVTRGAAMPFRAVVQSDGRALKLRGKYLVEEFAKCGALHDLLLRYAQVLLTQSAQIAACNRYHTVAQQLSRWLLQAADRATPRNLRMTQELIAVNLGVRREAITTAARGLQRAGVIDYSRGHITVLDRSLLEELACECYGIVRRETDRLLSGF